MPDEALATVARIREELIEAANALLPGLDPVRAFAAGGLHASALKALAGAEAALKLHGAEAWYCAASDCEHPEPPEDSDGHDDWYDDHTSGTGGIVVCLLTQEDSFCPECTRLKYNTLEPEGDDFVSAPCGTRLAIMKAIAGKATGNYCGFDCDACGLVKEDGWPDPESALRALIAHLEGCKAPDAAEYLEGAREELAELTGKAADNAQSA